MRTTLEIDDDIFQEARRIATAEGTDIGKALSDLAPQSWVPRRVDTFPGL